MKRSFWSGNAFRYTLAALIVLAGAAGMVAATLQNLGVILAPTPSSSSPTVMPPTSDFEKELARTQDFGNKLVGKTEASATRIALKQGFKVRTVARDNEDIPVTADLVSNRIDLWVRHNVVYKVTVG